MRRQILRQEMTENPSEVRFSAATGRMALLRAYRMPMTSRPYMQQGVDAAMQAVLETQSAWADAARTELGGQFEATVARAAAARDALATKVPGLTAMLNETGAGNRIEMIRLMAAVGELIGEDGGVRGGAAGAEKSIYPNTDFSRYN